MLNQLKSAGSEGESFNDACTTCMFNVVTEYVQILNLNFMELLDLH